MSLTDNRLCVFCGRKADSKTREHVVPYWLLELTGDPNRVVTFGQDFRRGKKPIRYAWSSFVAPACEKCNNAFADLEGRVKSRVEALQRREALTAAAYIEILDWLDKVRVGVWLLRHLIEKHPIEITPNFYIAARIAAKDRMLAVYAFEGDNSGINLLGSDSLIFSDMPSCFGLRINNILLLNVSTDFFCSKGCGLPHPASMSVLMGGDNSGKMILEGFEIPAHERHPIAELHLYKPVVWFYQPIKLPSSDPTFRGKYYGHTNSFNSRIYERTMEGNEQQGAIFRQFQDRVQIIRSPSTFIEFDEVVGEDCAALKDIAASIYEIQIQLFNSLRYEWVGSAKPGKFWKNYRKLKIEHTAELAKMYRTWSNSKVIP